MTVNVDEVHSIIDGKIGKKVTSKDGALRPTRKQAEDAVRTLISWAGDDPNREGLKDTPGRVVRSYEELCGGYSEDPDKVLARTFEKDEDYEDMVLLRDITTMSLCEHHMLPIMGKVHIAYIPTKRIVGLSKLARVCDIFGRRLQTQETMTVQIARSIHNSLKPKGVAVAIEAEHYCMSMRGVKSSNVMTHTKHMTGLFLTQSGLADRFSTLSGC